MQLELNLDLTRGCVQVHVETSTVLDHTRFRPLCKIAPCFIPRKNHSLLGLCCCWYGNGSFQYKRWILNHPRYHKVVVAGAIARCNPCFGGRQIRFILGPLASCSGRFGPRPSRHSIATLPRFPTPPCSLKTPKNQGRYAKLSEPMHASRPSSALASFPFRA